MTHTYEVTGMTCSSCEQKVKTALEALDHVNSVAVSKDDSTAIITMDEHIATSAFQKALDDKYHISALQSHHHQMATTPAMDQEKPWFETYKPVLMIFFYVLGVTLLLELTDQEVNFFKWMRHFMAGFFLTFSFFKMLNLKGFKDSYQMYDIIARRFPSWGYIYAFTELALGIAFLTNLYPTITNAVTFIVMSVSIIGVLQTVLDKKAIKCACLGDVFNLPMSTVTIIEDGLMILMSLAMLIVQIA